MDNDKKKVLHDSDNKYGDFTEFKAELEAVEKFENINRNSSHNLHVTQSRMILGFIVILCLTIMLGALSFVMSKTTTRDITNIYEGPLTVRYYAYSLDVNAHKVYLSMRNLALCDANDAARIKYYVDVTGKNRALMDADFAILKSLTEHDDAFKTKIAELETLLTKWKAIREENIQAALSGDMQLCRAGVTGPCTFMVNEINDYISGIAADATRRAASNHDTILDRSMAYDSYLLAITAIIALASIAIIIYVQRYTKKAITLVDDAQREQNTILDELIIMDETLRQSLARTEHEAQQVIEMKEKYANSLEAANDAIWELNFETKDFFASEKWSSVTGLPPMKEVDIEQLLQSICDEDRGKLEDVFNSGFGSFSIQVRQSHAYSPEGASPRWMEIRGKWLDKYRLTGSVSDITEHKLSEQYIEYIAYHDSITRLPNRDMFMDILQGALKRAEENGSGGCVLFVDLDDFNLVNDRHGHEFGDNLLFEIGQRIQQSLSGKALLASFGGDKFLILAEGITGEDEAGEYIKTVFDSLAAPFTMGGGLFYITASIGASLYPEDGNDAAQILKNSDAAMYESKGMGHNAFTFYNRGISAKLLRKAAIGDILHTAIESDIVYMVFQPQVRCSDGRVVGCEALMRLRECGLGFVSPAEFIPVAEYTHLIVPLGYWAIRKIIETELALREKGIILDSISVNISEIQLCEPDFVGQVRKIIDEYGYDASRLHFEVTESVLISNPDEELKILHELKSIGIKIELDDFGTGYSSLNYVRMLPLDVIKIDKCFIDEIGINKEKEGLIDLVVRLAEMSGAKVVAEGVETQLQVEFFKKNGDVILQGYYYSKPLETEDFEKKFKELNAAAQK